MNQPIYGWNNMPAWAKALSTIVGANEFVAQPIKGICDVYRGITDDQAARAKQAELNMFAKEAQPYGNEIERMKALSATDPTIGSKEGLADFAQRPDFWATPEGMPRPPQDNQLLQDKLSQFAAGNAGTLNRIQGNEATLGIGTPAEMAFNLGRNNPTKDQNEQLKMATDNRTAIDAAERLRQFSTEVQPILKDGQVTPDVKMATINQLGTQYGVPVERLKSMLDFEKEAANPLEQITGGVGGTGAGTEQPALRRKYATDGSFVPIGKEKQQFAPKAPITNVTVNGETATSAALKAFGPHVVTDLSKGYENATKAMDDNKTLDVIKKIVQAGNVKTGLGAETRMQAERALTAIGGKVPKGLTDAQILKSLNTQLAAKAARQGDPNPTQQQVAAMRAAYPGLSQEAATNLALVEIMQAPNKRTIDNHNIKVKGVRTWKGGGDLAPMMEGQYLVNDRPPLSSFKR